MEELVPNFPDVDTLLESSQPQPRVSWFWYVMGFFLLLVVGSNLASGHSKQLEEGVRALSVIAMVLLLVALPGASFFLVRQLRAEQQQVEGAAELVQLRRWPQAAMLLQQYLSRPARTASLRAQALIYLSAVLARYERFGEAMRVQEHLLENDLVDPATAYGLRLGRAMALLREDHLFDADRAISELRRMTGQMDSGGLALVEIYRDVKTGHPAEAIEMFQAKRSALREQLGHRLGDAYALVARAYDLLDREPEARAAFANATALAPAQELLRRYPELQKMIGRYEPTAAPPELA